MLIEFSVENFRSIKDEARLSLVAGPGKEHRETHLVTPELNEGVRSVTLVRSAAIYGANAAGKTNLVQALQAMRHIVLRSGHDIGDLPVAPFLFDPEVGTQPTTFEVVGIANRTRFQYGFSTRRGVVTDEWLYAWPKGRIQFWFERNTVAETGEVKCRFGDKLAGDKEVWRRATRPNALLLSTAITLNSRQLMPIFDWYRNSLRIFGVNGWAPVFSLKWLDDGNGKSEVIRFLRAADLAIEDLRVVEEDFLPEAVPEGTPSAWKNLMHEMFSGSKVAQVYVSHESGHDRSVDLDLDEESSGTQKMFAVAAPWLDALANGHVVVCDELHGSLHPALVRFLVDQFHDPEVNRSGAQLVFTTHDTSILSQDVFRRDQIWFCERNRRQETQVFPLTDFRPRRGVENLERSYLSGRYGAIPYIRRDAARSRA